MAVSSLNKKYTVTGLIKGTASLDEMTTLLQNWRPDEPVFMYAKRVQAEGIISKETAKRAEDLVVLVFGAWLLKPDASAARWLQKLVARGIDRQALQELLFLYKARAEIVLYDFTLERFWSTYNDGALYLQPSEIEDFLRFSQETGRVEKSWAKYTQYRLAMGILGALREIGFIREEKPRLYAYNPLEINRFTLIYLAYELHFAGQTDAALVDHPDWHLFGLERARVVERLSELGEQGGLIVQQAGSVVRLTWLFTSMEEVLDAYSG
ncbi:MAG: DUF1819 family protein [Chloroflexi bacterium]|nr:DUF1819 family protein [Chloroflexota bacterium]